MSTSEADHAPVVLKTDPGLVEFDAPELARIRAAGLRLVQQPCLDEAALIEHAAGVDALMVVAEPVTAKVIDSLERCRVITRFGSGLDNVDIEAATRRGIQVTYVPGASSEEVSDHALAMIFSFARHLPALDAAVRRGEWAAPAGLPPFRRLRGQTLGLVGLGRIGALMARKAGAFGLEVVAHDPYADAAAIAAAGAIPVELDELLGRSDFVSMHTPLTPRTRHLIGARELGLMKDTAFLVNVARGGVVDQAALLAALERGAIAGAGLDVFEAEPPAADSPLLARPDVILTPHLAHYSVESMDDLRSTVIGDVVAVLAGHPPTHPVNEVPAP